MRTAELLLDILKSEGVEVIFGLPGEETLDLADALRDEEEIKFVLVRHEQGAAFMADVWGRLTGEAGVCLSTLGPGATNLATGVADATLDSAPLVALTGQGATTRLHKMSHQYIDIHTHFRPITKWSGRVDSAETLTEMARRAFREAQQERPGAALLELPEDVMEEQTDVDEPITPGHSCPPEPSGHDLEQAVELINRAERPLLVVGNGVIRSGATSELRGLIEAGHLHAVNTFMAKGTVDARNHFYTGTIGMLSRDFPNLATEHADLLVFIGYDMVERGPKYLNRANRPVVHIGEHQAEVDANYRPRLQVVGDLPTTLARLADGVEEGAEVDYFLKVRRAIDNELDGCMLEPDDRPISPQRLLGELRETLDDQDIVLADVGANKMWVARNYPAHEPNTVLISNGLASMGFALPGSLAASLARPDQNVVTVNGDAGFMMNVQELETAVREGLDAVHIILNDNAYGLIKWKQKNEFGRPSFVDFSNPDFLKLAESFGASAHDVQTAGEFRPALEEALEEDVASVIDVNIDYSENERLSEMLGDGIEDALDRLGGE